MLGLTLVAVVVFALLGINEKGMTFAVWTFEVPGLNSNLISEGTFYKMYFVNLGIGIWLAWIATILALVSTASVMPDFVSSGSIELALSKPIGRLRLFLTKYVAALLFVVLQVAVFALGSFLVIGIRGGAWLPTVFLAIPIVTVFFSYLYCICALLGLITRSSVASLLLTILIWFVLFLLQQAETGLVGFKSIQEVQLERAQSVLEPVEADIRDDRGEAGRGERRVRGDSERGHGVRGRSVRIPPHAAAGEERIARGAGRVAVRFARLARDVAGPGVRGEDGAPENVGDDRAVGAVADPAGRDADGPEPGRGGGGGDGRGGGGGRLRDGRGDTAARRR